VLRQVRYREPALYMQQAFKGEPITQSNEVPRQDLPFEFMLNALRLRAGFALADFCERTGLAITSLQQGLQQAEKMGLIGRDLHRVWPTEKGFDFLSDLQALFLADSEGARARS
jgi:oxygen-independent coproporphyrinogen-3 oxidase